MDFTVGEARLIRECEELADLAAASDWLEEPQFSKNADGLLTWSFVLLAGERRIPLRLVFPALFPDLPPFVLPADSSVRLSQHQYGEGGELCLQYRPDNWHPDCKSTDVVRSVRISRKLGGDFTPSWAAISRPWAGWSTRCIGSGLTGWVKRFFGAHLSSHAVSGQGEAVGVVDQPVEDGVGQGRVTDGLMPLVDR